MSTSNPRFIIEEKTVGGNTTKTYLISSSQVSSSSKSSTTKDGSSSTRLRVDILPTKPSIRTIGKREDPSRGLRTKQRLSSLFRKLLTPFLPIGYPHTVTSDYAPYQIYDSLQAFASTIASLLASRAVLVGLGVGSESASATTAMLLSIAQQSIGHFATIFFAHYFALRIEAEVKFYRFLADVVNDAAFVLDLLSPSLPTYGRLPALCMSSACRAICGVAGGSSKAILSSHFAKAGNIGELNAKDGSQETVVNLVGMWVGGLVVSTVHGTVETWIWLLCLLGVHLFANWRAVKSVRLKSLNRSRATMVLDAAIQGQRIGVTDLVGAEEGVLVQNISMKTISSNMITSCCVGSNIDTFLFAMQGRRSGTTGAFLEIPVSLEKVIHIFGQEKYILWFDDKTRQLHVLLKADATSETQLKGWCHGMRFAKLLKKSQMKETSVESQAKLMEQSLGENTFQWPKVCKDMKAAGWDLSSTNLETGARNRVAIQDQTTKQE